jgi:hypothetical protein
MKIDKKHLGSMRRFTSPPGQVSPAASKRNKRIGKMMHEEKHEEIMAGLSTLGSSGSLPPINDSATESDARQESEEGGEGGEETAAEGGGASFGEGAASPLASLQDGGERAEDASGNGGSRPHANSWELQQMRAVESEINQLKARNRQLQQELDDERQRGQHGAQAMELMDTLRGKHAHSVARLRNKKADARRLEGDVRRGNERIVALSEHIEKLMTHLKHEAAAKAKALDGQRRATEELQMQKNRNVVLTKKTRARDKVIRELREGCKILEDQLRLMDQK